MLLWFDISSSPVIELLWRCFICAHYWIYNIWFEYSLRSVEYGQYHNDIHIKKNSKLYIFLAWSKIAKFYKRPVT